jgi:hypothetical protein
MLERLGTDNYRVFDAKLAHGNKMLVLTEACDNYFTAKLTKQQVVELAHDLLRIADEMVDFVDSSNKEQS